ncbi:MAG: hypothetical protein HWE16_05470 [Gammaproteobacteria bacterium]|nr:hypothetical protein [Gammaproteobacteria bacterium]
MSEGHYPPHLLRAYLGLTKGQLSHWLEYFDPRESGERYFTWGQIYQFQILQHLIVRCKKTARFLSHCQLEAPLEALSARVPQEDLSQQYLIIDYENKHACVIAAADFAQLAKRHQPTHLIITDLHHLYRLHEQRMREL